MVADESSTSMEITSAKENGVLIITMMGNLDSATSTPALEQMNALVYDPQPRLLFDGNQLDYVSSAGLRTLLAMAKKVRAAGGKIGIFGLKAQVREILEISGFQSIIPCHPDAATARAALDK